MSEGLTGIFGPAQDGGDLVALLRAAHAVAGGRAHADGVQVGLHSAQVGRRRGSAVRDLEVDAVGLKGVTSTHGCTKAHTHTHACTQAHAHKCMQACTHK